MEELLKRHPGLLRAFKTDPVVKAALMHIEYGNLSVEDGLVALAVALVEQKQTLIKQAMQMAEKNLPFTIKAPEPQADTPCLARGGG